MRPDGLTIDSGGTLPPAELAALCSMIATLIDEERAAPAADPIPAVYRSAWRSEGIRDALDAGTVR